MAINFPDSPTTNDIWTENDLSWKFNGTSWVALPTPSVAGNVAYTPAGTGAVATTIETKLRESISVKDFGAVGDGVADDTTAVNNAKVYANTDSKTLLIPKGDYLYSGTVYSVGGDFTWVNDEFATGVNILSQARNNSILLTSETSDEAVLDGSLSKVPLSVTVEANGGQHGSGIRSNLVNKSTDGNGCTAIYAKASNCGGSVNWGAAIHGETRHDKGTSIGISSENCSYSTDGSMYGVVINNTGVSAEETHPITGAAKVEVENAVACLILGSSTEEKDNWKYGLQLKNPSIRSDGEAIRIDANCKDGIYVAGTSYTSSAIKINQNQSIAFEGSGVITQKYSSSSLSVGLWNGATNFIKFFTNGVVELTEKLRFGSLGSPFDTSGSGTPEGTLSAPVGSTYRRTDGGAGTSFYVKESGTGNTGWIAK